MALLELGGKAFPIPVGELVLGSDAACGIVVSGSGVLPKHALFHGQPDGQVVIRKAIPSAEVMINGVRLGAEPTPLLHGDKVDVGGHELNFVDERRSGSTQFLQAVKVPEAMAQARSAAQAAPASANTGGRLVSLTDGREYVMSGASLVFGREASCDVVVGGKDVSRRHAEIVQTPKGYLIVDSSTNGTFVNEERVRGQRILMRADVVRIGDDNFRFYADVAPAAAPASLVAPTTPAPPPPPPPAPPAPAVPAAAKAPAAKRAPQSGSLATFLVKSGALKGTRFEARTPVVNVGRADYNDLPLADPSVSTSHAKLQRREGIWVLMDLDSTNGTFVDGERVPGEIPLAPGATLRFGDVEVVFEPTDDALGIGKGGGTVVMAGFSTIPAPAPKASAPAPAPAPAAAPAPAPAPPPPPPAPAPVAAKAPAAARAPAAPGARAPKAAQPAAAPKPARAPARAQSSTSPAKKGKGCGASVVVLVAGAGGLAALARWLLA